MTISTTDQSFTTHAYSSTEIPRSKKPVVIPKLALTKNKQLTGSLPPFPQNNTESYILWRMLVQQQYKSILKYLNGITPVRKLNWLNKYANYHVPLMLAQSLAVLMYDGSDIEDVAYIIHLAELRIKQDLACYGYSEEQQEIISSAIINQELIKTQKILNKTLPNPVTKSFLYREINRFVLVLPFELEYFDLSQCPPPIDWRIYYQMKISPTTPENIKNSWEKIRLDVLENFTENIDLTIQKGSFSLNLLTTVPEDNFDISKDGLQISYLKGNITNSNLLGLVFQRKNLLFRNCKDLQKNGDNGQIATLLHIWNEPNIKLKHDWLKNNVASGHPLLHHELAISIFELDFTLRGFKKAYEQLLVGTLRVYLDVECTTDCFLQEVPQILKALYRNHLLDLSFIYSSKVEFTKINWWEEFGAPKSIDRKLINRFLNLYGNPQKVHHPEWLFKHSTEYDASAIYHYNETNNFAFPHWLWKRQQMTFIHNLYQS